MPFVSLHNHSAFSFHAGVPTIKEMVSRARTLGMKALALTDTDRMSGLIRFYLECQRQGIQPILGSELTRPDHPDENIVLLAKNAAGYQDICEIITRRHMDGEAFSIERTFSRLRDNLFVLTHSPDCFRLLSRTPNRRNLFGELIAHSKRTRQRSREIVRISREEALPLVASNDCYFLHRDDWKTHLVLRAIGEVSTLSRLEPHEYASSGAFLKSDEEIRALFPYHREAIENSARIAASCHITLPLGEWIMPEISLPEGRTPQSYLETLAWEGLEENFAGRPEYPKARKIQRMELDVIARLRYPSYFLMVKQIRDWANRSLQSGYRRARDCSILRGSAANSITFYNIGVSDLDPIEHDLYFQRFLNEDRASPPDADLDFGWDEREQVLDYMRETWGSDRVAVVCTTNHFRHRAAFRETAKVFGYTEEQITRILKSWKSLSRRIVDEEIRYLLSVADKIRGKPRFLGQHPGGVLITNQPICRHLACEYSGGDKNRVITQVDMHNGLDELGLIKFDILGNGSLSVLRDTLTQIREQGLPDPRVWDMKQCIEDTDVRRVISKGRTKGIFYIESPAQTRLNKKVGAESFAEVTITSSLIRPAGSAYIKLFVERHRKFKQGIRDWEFLHPALKPILQETHDVCAFQEDVTKICHRVAGLSYREADRIRKMMNSLHEGVLTSDQYRATEDQFISGCMTTSGLSHDQATELWQRVSSFTGFSFCKSHSASYARLSFKCTYLKTHYPAQFFSAVISNRHGFYTPEVYLDEARRWGIRILPLDINESHIPYRGRHNWIRPGLMHLRQLSRKSMETIITERERNGHYGNLADFMRRVPVRRAETENLILAGAFDGLGLSRPESLFMLDGVYGRAENRESPLFPGHALEDPFRNHPGLSDYTLMEKCLHELRLLGFMLSANMLDILDLHPAARDAVPLRQISHFRGRRIKVFGRPVTERIHMVQQSGKPMKFLTLEDQSECVDVVFWPDIFEKFSDSLLLPGPFEIWGNVTEEWDTCTLEADRIRAVEWFPSQVDFSLASKRLEESLHNFILYDDIPTALAG